MKVKDIQKLFDTTLVRLVNDSNSMLQYSLEFPLVQEYEVLKVKTNRNDRYITVLIKK